jgi:hypothetical protein
VTSMSMSISSAEAYYRFCSDFYASHPRPCIKIFCGPGYLDVSERLGIK